MNNQAYEMAIQSMSSDIVQLEERISYLEYVINNLFVALQEAEIITVEGFADETLERSINEATEVDDLLTQLQIPFDRLHIYPFYHRFVGLKFSI